MVEIGEKYKVIDFECGKEAASRLRIMGIHKDCIIEVVAEQPYGPYIIKVGNTRYTLAIGRKLLNKILMEKI